MALIVGVHGIAQQLLSAEQLEGDWEPALRGGVSEAGGTVSKGVLQMAFYGALYRDPGNKRAAGDKTWRPEDVQDDEEELLRAWWQAAAAAEPGRVTSATAVTRGTPPAVQKGLLALARSSFFTNVTQSAMIGDLKQVRRYLREPALRQAACEAVHRAVKPDTRLIIGHSLGSVVAYEALHRYSQEPNWTQVRCFITIGSPLGIPNLIFDALHPTPQDGKGVWPPHIERWSNISDDGDVVALRKELAPLFPGALTDYRVSNEAKAHDAKPYLTARITGQAVIDALR
jgi:hypothetical protein